jgi:outer membrane protein assembly factor BamB
MVGSPAVSGGKVFIGSDSGVMYALDQATGAVVWQFQVVSEDPKCAGNQCEHGLCPCSKIRSSAAVDEDGNVYFGAYDYYFYKVTPCCTALRHERCNCPPGS